MRVLRHLVWSAVASLLLIGLAPATAQATAPAITHTTTRAAGQTTARAEANPVRPSADCPTDARTRGTNTAPNPPLEPYYLDDWRLGPLHLPTTGAIGAMFKGYHRTGRTSAYWFLGCYWQTDPKTGTSGWWYPDNDGFVLDHGKPVEKPLTLREGQMVDLFGSGRGNFLAPAGTPYAKRAIPPSNLDEFVTTYPSSYHLYKVLEPFTVQAGPIRPWFGQPGLGLQYKTSVRIPDLITSHNLEALN